MPPPSPLRVFLAEDDPELRRLVARGLRRDGHEVIEAADGTTLLMQVASAYRGVVPPSPDGVVVSDVRMPDRDGVTVLRLLHAHPWSPPFILITAFGDAKLHDEAKRLGALAVFDKPFDINELRGLISRIAERPRRAGSSV